MNESEKIGKITNVSINGGELIVKGTLKSQFKQSLKELKEGKAIEYKKGDFEKEFSLDNESEDFKEGFAAGYDEGLYLGRKEGLEKRDKYWIDLIMHLDDKSLMKLIDKSFEKNKVLIKDE